MVTFVVCAPAYSDKSAGCIMLHDLCDALVRLGHRAHIALLTNGGLSQSNDAQYYKSGHLWTPWPSADVDAHVQHLQAHAIVIYPEVVTGNPLGARHVVRYFLNKSGAINGVPVQERDTDYIVAYSRAYHNQPRHLLYRITTPDAFHDRGTARFTERGLDLSYVGKGALYSACGAIANTIEITRTWPADKAQLLGLMRACRYFFSWDGLTSTNLDAALCGAVPVLLNFEPIGREQLDASEIALPYLPGHWVDGEVFIPRVGAEFFDKQAALFDQRDRLNAGWLDSVHAFSTGAMDFFSVTS